MRDAGGPELHNPAKPGRSRLKFALSAMGLATFIGSIFCGWQINATLRQNRLDHELILALRNHRESIAIAQLDKGANPNARDDSAGHPLTLKEMFLYLFGRRRPVSKEAPSALEIAFRLDEDIAIEALFSHDAGASGSANSSRLPFIIVAVRNNNTALIKRLLQRDAKAVNACDSQGEPVIVTAASKKSWSTVELLLRMGANPSAMASPDSHSALFECLLNNAPQDLVDTLMVRSSRAIGQNDLGACLAVAVESRNYAIADGLFKIGARIGSWKTCPYPAIVGAAYAGDIPEIVRQLDYGADIDAHERFGPPICQAAGEGRLEAVRYLLVRGAKVDGRAYDGGTSLSNACERGYTSVVRLLLGHGANPNNVERDGITPLMYSAGIGDVESVRLLLKAGARVNDANRRGRTALFEAELNDHMQVAKLLRRTGGTVGSATVENDDR